MMKSLKIKIEALPYIFLDSFGCLFGCAGGQNGLGGAPGSQDTATISAPLEVYNRYMDRCINIGRYTET